MNILKALFGNSEQNPEEEKVEAEHKKFDLMKYDGVKAMKMGQFEYALRCFDEALKLKDDSEIRDYLSRVFIRLDRLDEALEQLQLMAVAEPDNTDVKLQMAHVCYMKEDYAAMSDAVEQALAVNGDLPQAHFMYAQSALKQGDVINGIARLTKAVALDDNYADARLLRAQTLLGIGDVKGAEEDSQWLSERIEAQEDVLLLAARVAHAKGSDDEAIELYNKVVDQNPFLTEAYAERGKIYFGRGDSKKAEEDMRKVLELEPQGLANVCGDYSAEGVEHQTKQAYSNLNPFGL